MNLGEQNVGELSHTLGASSGTCQRWKHYRHYRKRKLRTCIAGLGSSPHLALWPLLLCCPVASVASPRAVSLPPAATACSAQSLQALVSLQLPSFHLSPSLSIQFSSRPWGLPLDLRGLASLSSLAHPSLPAPRHHAKELPEWQQHWLPGAAGKQGGDIRRGCWQDGEGGPKGGREPREW